MSEKKLPTSRAILKQSFDATRKHLKQLSLLTLPFAIGVAVFMSLVALSDGASGGTFLAIGLLIYIAAIVYMVWLSVVLMRAMYQATHGSGLKLDAAKKEVGKVILPMIGLAFVTGVVTVAGMYLFLIPGIILSMMYYAAKGALIIDGKGVHESIYYSTELTRGRKWNLFWTQLWAMVLGMLALYLPGGILVAVVAGIGSLAGEALAGILAAIVYGLLIALALPFFTGIYTSIYGHLKKN